MPRGTGRKANPTVKDGSLSKYMPSGRVRDGYNDVEGKTDWAAVSPDYISAALVAADRAGGALLFGSDRAGTQYAITVFFGGEKNTFYWLRDHQGASQVEDWLLALVADVNSADSS